jgi:methyl-accepting chemotaxis protein
MKSWFMDLKIATKLIIGFLMVAVVGAIIGIVGIINIKSISDNDIELYEKMTVPISAAGNISTAFQIERVVIREMILSRDPSEVKKEIDKLSQRENEIDENLKVIDATIISENARDLYKDLVKKRNAFKEQVSKVTALAEQNRDEEALALVSETGTSGIASKEFQEAIDNLVSTKINDAKIKSDTNTSQANSTVIAMIIAVLAAIIVSFILGRIISNMISKPMKALTDVAGKLSVGDIDLSVKAESKDEIGNLMDAFSKIIDNIKAQAEVAKQIAAGELSVEITLKSDKDVLSKSMKLVVETLRKLVLEAEMLTKAAVEGKLSTRGNTEMFKGGYKEIVLGVNKTLDSVIGPLNVSADYVDKISKGNIPAKITDNYNGDFNLIKNNLNLCIDSINLLAADTGMLVEAALEGKLSTRADASKHSGEYRKIVEGVNKTLDAVIEPVKEAATVLQEMSNGNLKVKVKGNYKGDHADIKNALNDTIEALSSYVAEISEVLYQMSNSNLELEINNEYKGDFAKIKDSLNLIIQSFNEVFTEINNSADQVSSGSNQVSDGSQALSQGTTEQASSIEELTSSITEIAAQTKQNAVNATEANQLALTAKEGAEIGNSHMKEMLKSMEEINESSSNISKIIKVIDDIAFQTNILALNAAVEAARAGQHGKGFAVVAEEVRNLAARSANAAKQTTDLIEGSIKKVEIGTKIAGNTAESLDQIVEGVSKAADLVGEIAIASNEQATAISQINKGIEQVSDVVQNNSATAEQSAAASEELSSQAAMLKNMVGKFKLKKGSSISYKDIYLSSEINDESRSNKAFGYSKTGNPNKQKPKISLSNIDFGKY